MRDINGNNNGTIYDESTTIILNGGETYKDTAINRKNN
jgi:hypothetical protein